LAGVDLSEFTCIENDSRLVLALMLTLIPLFVFIFFVAIVRVA